MMERKSITKKLKLMVAAIEFGAIRSGYGCLTKEDYEKKDISKIKLPIWEGKLSFKAPTSVLFRPNKIFHSFGFDAEKHYYENYYNVDFKEWYFFQHLNMKSYIDKGALTKNTIIEDSMKDGHRMKAVDVFAAIIKYFKDRFLTNIYTEYSFNNYVHWVITVPAFWDLKAKAFMKVAAEKAGISGDQLTLISEPEAALLCCSVSVETTTTDGGKAIAEMQIGSQYIILNSGGATTDITVYEVTGPKMLKEIHQTCVCHFGGNTVTTEFVKFLTTLLGGPTVKEMHDKHPFEYFELMSSFEHKKTFFDVHKDSMVTIRLPFAWKEVFEANTDETIEKALLSSPYNRTVYINRDRLRISNELFRKFFDYSINNVLRVLDELFRKPAIINITALLAVGTDFELSVLINAIEQKCPNLTVIGPKDPDLAVLKGAVLYGFEPYTFTKMVWGNLEDTLRGLGLDNVIDLQDVFNENYQKSFWNRVYLVGPCSVGKSCLAKILVGEPVPTTRKSTDGIWIYMGKAGMNLDKMEWVFFPKGNAITEVLTNMLMSMSTYEEGCNVDDGLCDVPLDEITQTNETVKFEESTEPIQISRKVKSATVDDDVDTDETSHTMKDQQLPEEGSSDIDLADHIHKNNSLKNQKQKDTSQIEKNKAKKQNVKVVSDNSECEWMNEITSNMSPDKIHELIVKAVQEGKYKQRIVPIDIWDFGGQKDYYMTHQLFITSRGIFVLMFNGSIGLHQHMPGLNFLPGNFGKPTVAVYLLHWVNSILTYCKRTDDGFPKIIFVATHKDERWFQWTQEARRKQLENELQLLFETHGGLNHLEFKPLIFVDATNPDDAEIADLRERIMQRATEHPRWGEAMPTRWIPLELQLAQKSAEGTHIISYDQLLVLNATNESMILSERQLAAF
ncbi:unnamed protein product [Mytilus coruscus]|uniref:Uncharacterized protein n=1 Tax=Mytilus coruscus TaxID=42192 RepID=A0A6J8CXX9_MYTCO|nr:unnamed protein product [Mytilus coruscus]